MNPRSTLLLPNPSSPDRRYHVDIISIIICKVSKHRRSLRNSLIRHRDLFRSAAASYLQENSAPQAHFFRSLWTIEMIFSTTDGSERVEMSPSWSSSPARIFLRIRRMILPDRVLGRSGTM